MVAQRWHGWKIRGVAALGAAVSLLLAVLLVAACSISGGRGTAGDPAGTKVTPGAGKPSVKVAVLLPLTGGNSQKVAQSLKQAGELALFDFDNPSVELVPKDTRGTPEGARTAAQEAAKEGAELIIGPLFANEVSAAAPEAQRAGIPTRSRKARPALPRSFPRPITAVWWSRASSARSNSSAARSWR
jgi:ABC-type branched-subunit amino acid transport system substrate-binding protein